MTDRDQTIIFSLNGDNGDNGGPGRFATFDDFAATENRPADFVPGLVSLGFIKNAVLRSARFWIITALVGVVLGLGVYVMFPHQYQASATLLLTHGPYEDTQSAAANNQAIAQTRAVAGLALKDLGLQQTVSSFLTTYTVTPVTDRVLVITASAPTADQASVRANAVASAFLTFRANEMQTEQSLVAKSLSQQVTAAKAKVTSIGDQISQVSSGPASSAQEAQLTSLRTEQASAKDALGNLQQAVTSNQTTTVPALTSALKGSQVLSVAPLTHSKLKSLVLYAAFGFIAGLFLGMGIIIFRALVSDRLRQRDDIAYALDAPVKLSVGQLRGRAALPGRMARRNLDAKRVTAHLESVLPRSGKGPAGLAIVAVDNAPAVARIVAGLAVTCASRGDRVVTADLSQGAHLGHLLGAKGAGSHEVSREGADFTVAVPGRNDAAPVGPLHAAGRSAGSALVGEALVAPDAAADVVLALVTLDPALGGEHLATWATSAVVVVNAGHSSADRIHGIGEMIRLAGTRLDSIVLVGADKSDESLGLTPAYTRASA